MPVLITGVSSGGIGAACALSLATASPELLILGGRDSSKIADTAKEIESLGANPPVRVLPLVIDLASLASVGSAVQSLATAPKVDILINNAGIMAWPYGTTEDGFETQFGTNHLGHFQFTRLLLPKLQASESGGRVVNVSSDAYQYSDILWENVGFDGGKNYDKWIAYGQSKTGNILHALALSNSHGVKAYSVHPGIVGTNLVKEHARADIEEFCTPPSVPKLAFVFY